MDGNSQYHAVRIEVAIGSGVALLLYLALKLAGLTY